VQLLLKMKYCSYWTSINSFFKEIECLMLFLIWQKVQEAEALKASLENKGFVFKEESLRQLGVLAARDKQNLDEALRYKHELYVPPADTFCMLSFLLVNVSIINSDVTISDRVSWITIRQPDRRGSMIAIRPL
jgi:hypothetical protein